MYLYFYCLHSYKFSLLCFAISLFYVCLSLSLSLLRKKKRSWVVILHILRVYTLYKTVRQQYEMTQANLLGHDAWQMPHGGNVTHPRQRPLTKRHLPPGHGQYIFTVILHTYIIITFLCHKGSNFGHRFLYAKVISINNRVSYGHL